MSSVKLSKYVVIFLLCVGVIIAAIYIFLIKKTYKVGGSDAEVLYHGTSMGDIKVFTPRPSFVLDGDYAVFATDSYTDAVIFSVLWTDYDFVFGTRNGKKYLREMYEGAFDKLKTIGYVYRLPAQYFHKDKRTGLPNEYISHRDIEPISCDEVNVIEYLEKTKDIELISYDTPRKKVKFIPLSKKIAAIFTPLMRYYRPIINTKYEVIYFDRLSMKELEAKVKAAKGRVILIGDKFVFSDGEYDIPTTVLRPEFIEYNINSAKTTPDQYKKYIEARIKKYEQYPTIVLKDDIFEYND